MNSLRKRPDCHWLSRRREARAVPQAERRTARVVLDDHVRVDDAHRRKRIPIRSRTGDPRIIRGGASLHRWRFGQQYGACLPTSSETVARSGVGSHTEPRQTQNEPMLAAIGLRRSHARSRGASACRGAQHGPAHDERCDDPWPVRRSSLLPVLDHLQLQRSTQRRPGVVAMPPGQLDQLIEGPGTSRPVGTGIRPRLHLGHCLALTHRKTHLLGVCPIPRRPRSATHRYAEVLERGNVSSYAEVFVSQRVPYAGDTYEPIVLKRCLRVPDPDAISVSRSSRSRHAHGRLSGDSTSRTVRPGLGGTCFLFWTPGARRHTVDPLRCASTSARQTCCKFRQVHSPGVMAQHIRVGLSSSARSILVLSRDGVARPLSSFRSRDPLVVRSFRDAGVLSGWGCGPSEGEEDPYGEWTASCLSSRRRRIYPCHSPHRAIRPGMWSPRDSTSG